MRSLQEKWAEEWRDVAKAGETLVRKGRSPYSAIAWLTRDNPRLGGRSPLLMLCTGNGREVESLVEEYETLD